MTLFWNPRTNHVFVVVVDQRSGELRELKVETADALQAFRHPFAYADTADGDGWSRRLGDRERSAR